MSPSQVATAKSMIACMASREAPSRGDSSSAARLVLLAMILTGVIA